MTAQWVQLGDGETLVATSGGAWIQAPQGASLELRGAMPGGHPSTVQTTRHLLEGAIAAGERGQESADDWPPTARTWALSLIDQWYTAHHSVALLPAAIEQFESMRRFELARFARHKLQEEAGHDRLPLDDLRALGYEAEATVRLVPAGERARSVVRYARRCVHGPRPVRVFGFVFALERGVLRMGGEALQALGAALPGGLDAASGVRSHAVDFDHGHVEDLAEFVASLPAEDRTQIALACHRTAAVLRTPAPGEGAHELERRLALLDQTMLLHNPATTATTAPTATNRKARSQS